MTSFEASAFDDAATWRQALGGVPVGIAVFDTTLRYLHVNSRLAELDGLSIEAHLGRPVTEVLGGQLERNRFERALREVLFTGEPRPGVELEFSVANGGTRACLVDFCPLRRGDRVVGVCAYVSESSFDDRRLHELLDASPAQLAIYKGPDHELIFRKSRTISADFRGKRSIEAVERVYRTGEPEVAPVEHAAASHTGPARIQVLEPWRGSDGAIAGVAVFTFELTEEIFSRLRSAELRAHRDELAQWKAIFSHATWGVVSIDARTDRITAANEACARMHGYEKASEMLGLPISELLSPRGATELASRRAQFGPTDSHSFEGRHTRKDGSTFPCLSDVMIVRDARGAVLFRAASFQDISEQKDSEARLLRLHAMAVAANQAINATQVARAVVEEGLTKLGASLGAVVLRDSLGGITLAAQFGFQSAHEETLSLSGSKIELPGPLSQLLERGESLWIESADKLIEAIPEFADLRKVTGNSAFAAVPFRVEGEVAGLIWVSYQLPRAFSVDDRAYLSALAQQCGQALGRVRLYEAEARARARTERAYQRSQRLQDLTAALARASTPAEVAQAAAELCPRVLGADRCSVLRWNGTRQEMLASSGYTEEQRRRFHELDPARVAPVVAMLMPLDVVAIRDLAAFAARFPTLAESAEHFDGKGLRIITGLSVGNRWLGTIWLGWDVARDASADECAVLHTIGQLCAQALERAQLFEQQAVSEQRFRILVEATTAVVWWTNGAGETVSESPTLAAFTGQSTAEYQDRGWMQAIHPDDRARVAQAWNESVATKKAYACEYRLRRRDGAYRLMLARGVPVFDADGSVHEWVGTNVDVTDARAAAESLRLSNERAHLAVEAAALGTWDLDLRTHAVTWNARSYEIFGMPHDATLTLDVFFASLHPDDRLRVQREYEEALDPQGDQCFDAEHRVVSARDGSVRWCRSTGRAFFERELPVRMVGTVQDITEQRQRADEAQRRAEFEGQLIGIVSHDLKNPVSAMIMSADLLLRRKNLDEATAKTLLRIRSSGHRVARMIRDLLDFTQARLGSGLPMRMQPADVHTVVARTVEEVQAAYADREIHHRTSGDGKMEFDADRLSQLVTNLLSNALHYSAPGTPVDVSTSANNGDLVIEVHNDGEPIPAEAIPSLFRPLQRGTQGTDSSGRSIGLGLFIVDQIVKGHGGDVAVTSTAEHGTTFRVTIPRLRVAQPEGPK